MGCDIHMYVEVRKENVWKHYDWRKQYCRGTYDDGSLNYDYKSMWKNLLYIDRNYNLFAILANVRNGYGFAGIDTGNGFVPISMPKGLPSDVSYEIQEESNGWGCDGHSHSYFVLSELLNYNWQQITKHRGIVNLEEYKIFKENSKPTSWCGGIGGRNIKNITNEEMDKLISSDKLTPSSNTYYTKIEWEGTYQESAGKFFTKIIPALRKLGDPENVRIVF